MAVCIIGSKNSGKSFLLQYLLYNSLKNKSLFYGIVFCPTQIVNKSYSFIPEQYIYTDTSKFQSILEAYIEMLYDRNKDEENIKPSFIAFDDCIGTIETKTSFFIILVSTFRHLKISLFLVSQYPNQFLIPVIKENIDYYFLFKSTLYNTNHALANITGMKNDKEYVKFADNYNNEKYNCLFYDENEFNIENKFAKYITPEYSTPRKFKY